MQRLILSTDFPELFVRSFLPRYIKSLLRSDYLKIKDSAIVDYAKKEYKCSDKDIISCFSKLKVDKYKNIYILHYDVEDQLNFKNPARVKKILHMITYGNREAKGTRLVDSAFLFIRSHIRYIYKIYTFNETREKRINNGDKILRWSISR